MSGSGFAPPPDEISPALVYDPQLGVSYPARALIWIGSYAFVADEPADWRAVMQRVGLGAGSVIAIPEDGPPPDAWLEADLRMARLIRCSCGDGTLDPDDEGFALGLCPACREESEWENTHSDQGHDAQPDLNCPICQQLVGAAWLDEDDEHDDPR